MQTSLEAELPLGFGLALAQRPEAIERFAALSEAERQAVLQRARAARSKQEMQFCVDLLFF